MSRNVGLLPEPLKLFSWYSSKPVLSIYALESAPIVTLTVSLTYVPLTVAVKSNVSLISTPVSSASTELFLPTAKLLGKCDNSPLFLKCLI